MVLPNYVSISIVVHLLPQVRRLINSLDQLFRYFFPTFRTSNSTHTHEKKNNWRNNLAGLSNERVQLLPEKQNEWKSEMMNEF